MNVSPRLHEIARDYLSFVNLAREMTALGVRFRLSGAGAVVDGVDRLPQLLQSE